jgi:translation initiation factor IF-2
VREVREGFECGIAVENFNDIKVGDVIECYRTEEVARTLASTAAT